MARQSGRFSSGPRLSPEQAARQGRISQIVIARLGATAAIDFLNGYDEKLGGRPLELAIDSVEGLRAVEERLEDQANA